MWLDRRDPPSHHLTPPSTPVRRPTDPTVLATGEPMWRSTNSAPYLNRGEYDFEEEYAEREPLMAVDKRGCEVSSKDSRGSGCWAGF